MAARMRQPQYWTDWFRVLSDLAYEGWDNHRVAKAIEVARPTLLGWKNGNEPCYEHGRRLVELWCQVTGKSHQERPIRWG
jgi:hypothetical protein